MELQRSRKLRQIIAPSANYLATATVIPLADLGLSGYKSLIVTLDVTAADFGSANETYDVYITLGDNLSEWDVVHFPQIASAGAKRYTARVMCDRLAEVTTATPGVAAEPTAIMKTDTGGSNEGSKTLAAGKVRHGPFADRLGAYIVIAGTITTGITFSLSLSAQ